MAVEMPLKQVPKEFRGEAENLWRESYEVLGRLTETSESIRLPGEPVRLPAPAFQAIQKQRRRTAAADAVTALAGGLRNLLFFERRTVVGDDGGVTGREQVGRERSMIEFVPVAALRELVTFAAAISNGLESPGQALDEDRVFVNSDNIHELTSFLTSWLRDLASSFVSPSGSDGTLRDPAVDLFVPSVPRTSSAESAFEFWKAELQRIRREFAEMAALAPVVDRGEEKLRELVS